MTGWNAPGKDAARRESDERGQRKEVPKPMTNSTLIGNPGTTLSCATPMGMTAGRGTGLRWADVYVAAAVRVRHLVAVRVNGTAAARTIADLPTSKQPKIHVPQPPLERSP